MFIAVVALMLLPKVSHVKQGQIGSHGVGGETNPGKLYKKVTSECPRTLQSVFLFDTSLAVLSPFAQLRNIEVLFVSLLNYQSNNTVKPT
jgi:hypothetical protein